MKKKSPFNRAQMLTLTYGILCFVILIVVLQLWLLTATMNAYLGGNETVIWPAASASAFCLALNLGLLYYLNAMDRS